MFTTRNFLNAIFYVAATLLLISKDIFSAFTLLLLLSGGWAFLKPGHARLLQDKQTLESWRWILIGFWVFVTSKLILGFVHQNHSGYFEIILPFLLIPFLGLYLMVYQPSFKGWLISLVIAAVAGFGLALYQLFELQIGRAFGGVGNPILFGDASVALATVLFIVAVHLFQHKDNFGLIALLVLGGLMCILNSLLSGSKGGWLTVITVLTFATYMLLHTQSWVVKRTTIVFLLIALALLAYAMPTETVWLRIHSGVQGAWTWFSTGQVTDGSVSIRLEMWTFSWNVFLKNFVLGVSSAEMHSLWSQHIQIKDLDPVFNTLTTRDNELLETLAGGGVLGALGWGTLYGASGYAFWRLRNHADPRVRVLSWTGLMLVIAFMEFGLSVNVMGVGLFRLLFAYLLVVLMSYISITVSKSYIQHSSQ